MAMAMHAGLVGDNACTLPIDTVVSFPCGLKRRRKRDEQFADVGFPVILNRCSWSVCDRLGSTSNRASIS